MHSVQIDDLDLFIWTPDANDENIDPSPCPQNSMLIDFFSSQIV